MCTTADTRLRTVDVLGHPVRVSIRTGTGHRVPLVLCNGLGASLELLAPLVRAIDPATEVISFDVPGVGGSPSPLLPFRFSGLALLLNRLLCRLGRREVDVLGFSWGGGLAQQFALQYPRRCRRLVLVCTATGMTTVPGNLGALSKMLTPRRYRDPEYAAAIASSLYGGSLRTNSGRARDILGPQVRLGDLRGYLYQLSAGLGWSSLPWLALIRQPTLLLFGDDDPIIPLVNGRIMHRLLPHGELHVFPGGHLELLTRTDALAPLIDEFLGRGRLPGSACWA
jgi:poly(3-hydroxyalkanoate) depolymerase